MLSVALDGNRANHVNYEAIPKTFEHQNGIVVTEKPIPPPWHFLKVAFQRTLSNSGMLGSRMTKKHVNEVLTTAKPEETLSFIVGLYLTHFPGQSTTFLNAVFGQVLSAFSGTYPGYQGCDTAFHDFAHTCQAAIAAVRILDGQRKIGRSPVLTPREFELCVAGILLHDIGLLKEVGDNSGTGAKYTLTHVDRGADFASKFLPAFYSTPDEVRLVQLGIHSTAMDADMSNLSFRNVRERFIGCVIGTADLLGQMAAPNYPDQLPALYREFREAASYSHQREGGIASYRSVEDLLRGTREFYQQYVRPMLESRWDGVYKLLEYHYSDHRNHYLIAIELNLDRIDRRLKS